MLAELFKAIVAHCTDQTKVAPVVIPCASSKREIAVYNPATKEIDIVQRERANARHELLTIEALITFVQSQSFKRTYVWVGNDRVTVELNQHSEADILTHNLKPTPLFEQLQALAEYSGLTQAEAVKLLRVWLRQFDTGAAALAAVRSLKLTRGESIESDLSHDTARIGKSILQSAAGGAKLPEFIDVKTAVFETNNDENAVNIRVWVSIDFESARIVFEPDAQDMQNAIDNARFWLVEELRGEFKDSEGCGVTVLEGVYRVEPS